MRAWVMTAMDVSVQETVTTWIWKGLFWTATGQNRLKKRSNCRVPCTIGFHEEQQLICHANTAEKNNLFFFKTPKSDDCEICCNCTKLLVILNLTFADSWVIPVMKTVRFSSQLFLDFFTLWLLHKYTPKDSCGMPTASMATAKLTDRTVGIGEKGKN